MKKTVLLVLTFFATVSFSYECIKKNATTLFESQCPPIECVKNEVLALAKGYKNETVDKRTLIQALHDYNNYSLEYDCQSLDKHAQNYGRILFFQQNTISIDDIL